MTASTPCSVLSLSTVDTVFDSEASPRTALDHVAGAGDAGRADHDRAGLVELVTIVSVFLFSFVASWSVYGSPASTTTASAGPVGTVPSSM